MRYTLWQVVQRWHQALPRTCMIACDSYFTIHRLAQYLAAQRRPFIGVCGKNTKWVHDIGKTVPEGQLGMSHNSASRDKYALFVFKAPKLTKRAAKMVPLLTNAFEAEGLSTARVKPFPGAKDIPYVVQVYRDLAQTVNQPGKPDGPPIPATAP